MIDIYDDVLEEHNAILVDDTVKQLSWKYDYLSLRGGSNKHWHILCGHNEEECTEAGYDWAYSIFETAMHKYKFPEKYYPRLDWETEWGGGTAIYQEGTGVSRTGYPKNPYQIDKSVTYKGNRLIVFDAYLPHQALPVSRECYELRTCVVFKCNVSGGSRERLDFYKENVNKDNFKVQVIN